MEQKQEWSGKEQVVTKQKTASKSAIEKLRMKRREEGKEKDSDRKVGKEQKKEHFVFMTPMVAASLKWRDEKEDEERVSRKMRRGTGRLPGRLSIRMRR